MEKEEESKTLPTCYPSTPTLLLINTASSRSDLTKPLQWLNPPSRVQQMTWKINSDQKERPPHHLTYRLHRDAVGTWKRKFWSCNTTQNNMGTKKHERNYSHSGNPEKINGNKNEPKQQQTHKSKWKDQETIWLTKPSRQRWRAKFDFSATNPPPLQQRPVQFPHPKSFPPRKPADTKKQGRMGRYRQRDSARKSSKLGQILRNKNHPKALFYTQC
jgi:hypothetical protein